jgi:hypothetical protein
MDTQPHPRVIRREVSDVGTCTFHDDDRMIGEVVEVAYRGVGGVTIRICDDCLAHINGHKWSRDWGQVAS